MEHAPIACLVSACGTQGCCTGAASSSQQRSASHRHPFSPGWGGTHWRKDGQHVSNGIGKGHEASPAFREDCDPFLSSLMRRSCPVLLPKNVQIAMSL
jgi:hypothetical protein